jgi:hypothetical protein
MTRQEGGQCSIGLVRARTAWLGAIGVAGAAVVRALKRKPAALPPPPDPRAEELRQRLDESRALVDEREEFESAETPVDEAEVDDRRRAVHERGRAAADQMRGDSGSSR